MLGLAALCGLGEVVDNWWIHGGSQIALRRKTGIERESASRMVIVLFHSIMEAELATKRKAIEQDANRPSKYMRRGELEKMKEEQERQRRIEEEKAKQDAEAKAKSKQVEV
ncbi:hypothetical protein M407DRAFT_218351, partial [Tulasnella calospora MUT 4182]